VSLARKKTVHYLSFFAIRVRSAEQPRMVQRDFRLHVATKSLREGAGGVEGARVEKALAASDHFGAILGASGHDLICFTPDPEEPDWRRGRLHLLDCGARDYCRHRREPRGEPRLQDFVHQHASIALALYSDLGLIDAVGALDCIQKLLDK
jgi:hypothetical protein